MPSPFDSFQIDPDVAKAWTLPTFLYTDETVFAAEKQKIFARTWQVVGHASQVANPGDFFTTELVGEPLLFVRGLDGKLRGFYNVCRHRAGPPAEGCGSRKLFRCGYHGWTYGLDGALISATDIEGVEGIPPGGLCVGAGADRGVVQSGLCQSGAGGPATAAKSGRTAEASREIHVSGDEAVRAAEVRHEM